MRLKSQWINKWYNGSRRDWSSVVFKFHLLGCIYTMLFNNNVHEQVTHSVNVRYPFNLFWYIQVGIVYLCDLQTLGVWTMAPLSVRMMLDTVWCRLFLWLTQPALQQEGEIPAGTASCEMVLWHFRNKFPQITKQGCLPFSCYMFLSDNETWGFYILMG